MNIDNVEYYLFKMVSVLEPVDHKMEEVLLRNLFVFYLESCPESIRTGILAMLNFWHKWLNSFLFPLNYYNLLCPQIVSMIYFPIFLISSLANVSPSDTGSWRPLKNNRPNTWIDMCDIVKITPSVSIKWLFNHLVLTKYLKELN